MLSTLSLSLSPIVISFCSINELPTYKLFLTVTNLTIVALAKKRPITVANPITSKDVFYKYVKLSIAKV